MGFIRAVAFAVSPVSKAEESLSSEIAAEIRGLRASEKSEEADGGNAAAA